MRRKRLKDSSTTSQDLPDCDSIKGTGMLPSTLLGLVAPVVDFEGEYGDRTSSGNGPDLDVFEISWIDATMEWSNHTIALQASAEVVTHSLDDPREGEDAPDGVVGESCDVGVIGVTRDLEGAEMVGAICEEHLLVPRFKGEEDDRCETMDILVAEHHPTQIEFPVVEVFDHAPKPKFGHIAEVPPMFWNPAVGSAKFLEGLETHYDASTTHIPRCKPFSVGGTYKKGQGGVKDLDEGGGLTIVDTIHLKRPAGNVFVSVKPQPSKIFNLGDFALEVSHERVDGLLPSVGNFTVGCMRFSVGAEADYDEWALPFLFSGRFEPSWAIRTNGKGHVDVESLFRGRGLTLGDIAHLLRPPRCILKRWWKDSALSSLLIAIVDACHMVLAHQVISLFWSVRHRSTCVGLRGTVGICVISPMYR